MEHLVSFTCQWCGKQGQARGRNGVRKFCGDACAVKYHAAQYPQKYGGPRFKPASQPHLTRADLDAYPRVVERFWKHIDTSGECWRWTGCCTGAGYGQIGVRVQGRPFMIYAHRLAVLIEDGTLAADATVLHRCDHPWCARRSHLLVGTVADNVKDAYNKGRGRPPRLAGEKHPGRKLSEQAVRDLRARRAAGEGPTALAHAFGVSVGTIYAVLSGRNWREVR